MSKSNGLDNVLCTGSQARKLDTVFGFEVDIELELSLTNKSS